MSHDVLVLGGGLNGLVAATSLAKSGRSVALLDARPTLGGLAAAEEFDDGFFTPGVLHDVSAFPPAIADALALSRFGLKITDRPPRFRHGDGEGRVVTVPRDESDLDRIPAGPDRDGWRRTLALLGRVGPFLRGRLESPPPPLKPESLAGWMGLLGLGLEARRLGQVDLIELLRVLPMCVADWAGESLSDPLLRAAVSAPALEASFLGPWSGGTTALAILRAVRSRSSIEGGAPALVAALAAAADDAGVETLPGREVAEILVREGRAHGVRLFDGNSLDAPIILSTIDPKTTLLDLVAPTEVSSSLAADTSRVRARGMTAKLDLALSSAPIFAGAADAGGADGPVAWYRTGADVDSLERAYDAAKYRRFSDPPLLEVHVPTHARPDLAPSGRHVASVLIHFAPRNLDGGWTVEAREALREAALIELERHAPGIRESVLHSRIRTPADLEDEFGLSGGHLHHGEHAPDQLLSLRPTHTCGEYRTPILGLFLGGSGSHPGGGLSGMPGLLAARAIINAAG